MTVAGGWFSLPTVTRFLGAAFWPGAFAVVFFAVVFFAADFFGVDFFGVDFTVDFFAVDFFTADFLTDVDLATIKKSIEESDHVPKRRNSKAGETYR